MNYWIFTVTSHKLDGETTGDNILQQRVQDQFWGLSVRTYKVDFHLAPAKK